MIKNIKIIGAGSIGNHMSHAARTLGWSVDLCDIDNDALIRTKEDIYPSRYNSWDEKINLYNLSDAPNGNYDLIIIGTPPDSHISLAIEAIREKPKAILIEKPICTPNMKDVSIFLDLAKKNSIYVFSGYDHVLGEASEKICNLLNNRNINMPLTMDVEFREHWGGIFAAHPWLNGPSDSYLGFWNKGGGACGEHSHAINLWQYFSNILGVGDIIEVQALLDYVENNEVSYDQLCCLNVTTDKGFHGRIVQDVVTKPPKKWARIQCKNGFLEWHCGYKEGHDAVIENNYDKNNNIFLFTKNRPDDFIRELNHIEMCITNEIHDSPISIEKGLKTMLVIAAAHKSSKIGKSIKIDYSVGYTLDALSN